MLGAAIVPKCERIRLPVYSAGQAMGLAYVIKQHVQYRLAFRRVQPLDVRRESAVDE